MSNEQNDYWEGYAHIIEHEREKIPSLDNFEQEYFQTKHRIERHGKALLAQGVDSSLVNALVDRAVLEVHEIFRDAFRERFMGRREAQTPSFAHDSKNYLFLIREANESLEEALSKQDFERAASLRDSYQQRLTNIECDAQDILGTKDVLEEKYTFLKHSTKVNLHAWSSMYAAGEY